MRPSDPGRGVFLDLDGTLADTVAQLETAYRKFLGEFDILGSKTEFDSLNGPPLIEVIARLRRTHHLLEPVDELYALYLELLGNAHRLAPPTAGAVAVLQRARSNNISVAVVTSGTNAQARDWLLEHHLSSLVAAVVGCDDVLVGKPDPAPYRLALERTGCRASVSIAVEDSVPGLRSALGAGLPTMVVGPEVDEEVERSPLFRGRLLTLEELARRL